MHDEEFPETDGLESGKFCLQGRPLKDCPGYCMGFKPIGSKKLNQALSCTLAMVKEPDSNPYTAGQNGNPDISDQEFRSLMKATKPRWDKLSPKLQHIACREITEALILLYLYWGYYLCLEKKLVLKDLEKTELRKIFEEELERQMSVHTSGERSKQSLYYILQVDRPRARRSSIARSKC
ncbi:hypothetical protein BDZ91DRAFT_712734 [Kalaharituber pfeilii]|nr:hypothetical protein BDZ91DRAFT_712734 [Kalaharituber pfeilii]